MKRLISIFFVFVFLAGCSGNDTQLQRATGLRERLLKCNTCSFRADISADYGDQIFEFSMDCKADSKGNLTFTVVKPNSIEGIQGGFSNDGGRVTFDDQVLAFPKLADGELSPVSAPWLLIKTLMGGYLTSCGTDDHGLRITIDDTYEEDALQLDIWMNDEDLPFFAEIMWQGRRILSMNVDQFEIM